MAKRNKKANLAPKFRRPDRPALTMRRAKPDREELNYIPSMIKNQETPTFSGDTVSKESAANSDLQGSNENPDETTELTGADRNAAPSSNVNCEYTNEPPTLQQFHPTVSEATIDGIVKINPVDVRLKIIPPPMAENTFILPIDIPPKMLLYKTDTTNLNEATDSTAESKTDSPTQSTSRVEAVRFKKPLNVSTTVLENEVDEVPYFPVREPERRVKRKIRKKYKTRPPNLKQRADIAVRRLKVYFE